MIKYISNSAHYQEVIAQIKTVKHTLWIGTRHCLNITELFMKNRITTTIMTAVMILFCSSTIVVAQSDNVVPSGFPELDEWVSKCKVEIRKARNTLWREHGSQMVTIQV